MKRINDWKKWIGKAGQILHCISESLRKSQAGFSVKLTRGKIDIYIKVKETFII